MTQVIIEFTLSKSAKAPAGRITLACAADGRERPQFSTGQRQGDRVAECRPRRISIRQSSSVGAEETLTQRRAGRQSPDSRSLIDPFKLDGRYAVPIPADCGSTTARPVLWWGFEMKHLLRRDFRFRLDSGASIAFAQFKCREGGARAAGRGRGRSRPTAGDAESAIPQTSLGKARWRWSDYCAVKPDGPPQEERLRGGATASKRRRLP